MPGHAESTPDGAGGSGAGIAESPTVIEEAARFTQPIPVAERDLLAAWLLDGGLSPRGR